MQYANPYTPGAGAMPAYLAGRDDIINNASKDILSSQLFIMVCAVLGKRYY